MALTRTPVVMFATDTAVAVGLTKATAAPTRSNVVDARAAAYGNVLARISNDGSLLVACTIMIQESHDGVDWYDLFPISCRDLTTGAVTEVSIPNIKGGMYYSALAYGNTNSTCKVKLTFELTTGP